MNNTNNPQYFNNMHDNNDNSQQLKRKLLERLEVEELIKEEKANKKQITENMIKEMENLSIQELNNKEDMDLDYNTNNCVNSNFSQNEDNYYYLEDFLNTEEISSETIKLPQNKNNEEGIKLVIPDSILKISKPLPEILFKNNVSRGKELVLYRPVQWPWNKKNNSSFKPSFTPLIEEIDEDEDMFESDDIPHPNYCLNQSYPTSIIEPTDGSLNYQNDFNSNDADDEDSIQYCHIHDTYHPPGCYQTCDISQSSEVLNSQQLHDNRNLSLSDDMDCSL